MDQNPFTDIFEPVLKYSVRSWFILTINAGVLSKCVWTRVSWLITIPPIMNYEYVYEGIMKKSLH